MTNMGRWLLIAGILGMSAEAAAQEQPPNANPQVVYKKKTVFTFSGDTIDGDLTRPDGAYVESRKRIRHSNLIKIRDNFRDKILQSVSEI